MPPQEIKKLFLNLRRSDVIGIKIVGLRLLLDLLSFIELLVIPSAAKLAENILEHGNVDLWPSALRGLKTYFQHQTLLKVGTLTLFILSERSVTLA